MKKFVALLLALVMVLSMAACAGKTEPAKTDAPAATDSTEQSATEAPATTEAPVNEEHPTWLCDEKTTLTVLTYDGVNNTFPAPSNDLPFWTWLEDYTNVHIEWEVVPYAGYTEVMSTRVSAGADLPDIVMVNDTLVCKNAGVNGLFVNLADYWDTCFTNTEAYFAADGTDYTSIIKNEDGSFYGLCGTVAPIEGHIVLMYNTEWMNKLGLEIPTTLDEFNAVLDAMKAAGDLNGNGEDDEVILTSSGFETLSSVLGQTFDLNCYESWDQFGVENGVVFPQYTCDNQKIYLTYLNDLYTKGILDAEISSMSADQLSEKIASDRVGVFAYYSAFAITYGSLTSAGVAAPMEEHYTLGNALASEYNNNTGYFTRRSLAKSQPTAVNVNCENIELACKWLDTMFANPDVLRVRTCGFEGENYELNADGSISLIYPEDGSAWNVVSKGCGQISLPFIQTKEQLLNSKMQYEWYIAEYDELRENANWIAPAVTQVTAFTDHEQELIDEVRTDCRDYWKEMRDKFVTGQSSIDAEWDTYVSNIQKLGLDTFTEAWQSVYDRTAG